MGKMRGQNRVGRGGRWLLWPFLPFLKTCATLVSFAWFAREVVSRLRETTTFFDGKKERLLSRRLGGKKYKYETAAE